MADTETKKQSECPAEVSKTSGKRICCVCKPTKQLRDECIVMNGEDQCRAFIDAHNQCLRAEGFDVAN
jgi:cytochrome c oxidase assembly protein subunit 17